MIKLLLKVFSLLGFEITLIKPIKRNMTFKDNHFDLNDIVFHKDYGFGYINSINSCINNYPIEATFYNIYNNINYFIYTKHGSFNLNYKTNVIYNTKQYKIYTNKCFKHML